MEKELGAKILVVEDDELRRDMLVEKLQEAGYEVVACQDLKEALQALKENKFRLILTDYNYPTSLSNGAIELPYELPAQLRSEPCGAQLVYEVFKAALNRKGGGLTPVILSSSHSGNWVKLRDHLMEDKDFLHMRKWLRSVGVHQKGQSIVNLDELVVMVNARIESPLVTRSGCRVSSRSVSQGARMPGGVS